MERPVNRQPGGASREGFKEHDAPTSPVIGGEFGADGEEDPELVFLPSERVHRGDMEAAVEFRRTEDGQLVVLAYTSVRALVEACGEKQPWVALPSVYLEQIVAESGADSVLWNAELPDEQRREEPSESGGSR